MDLVKAAQAEIGRRQDGPAPVVAHDLGRAVDDRTIRLDRRRASSARSRGRDDDEARTRLPVDLVGFHLDAVRARKNGGLQPTTGLAVEKGDGVAFLKRGLGPDLLPLALHHGDAEHIEAHLGQAIFRPRAGRDLLLAQQAGCDQLLQSVGQHAARRPQAFAPHAEASHAVEGLAHDQLGPGVAGDGEGSRHGIAHDQGSDVGFSQISTWPHRRLWSCCRYGLFRLCWQTYPSLTLPSNSGRNSMRCDHGVRVI